MSSTGAFERSQNPTSRAQWLAQAGGLNAAISAGNMGQAVDLPLAEALVLGLMRQGVTKYLAIFGHGSTELAEVLRIYQSEGLVECFQFRNEVEMAHVGTALRWVYDEPCAVATSIGPGAFQAMAGSLTAASNGIGVYHIYGDETTHGEGYNMQQVPKPEQGLFGQITGALGQSYTLHTPAALRDALRRGAGRVFHPWKAGPFYLNLPLNSQPAPVTVRLDALPQVPDFGCIVRTDDKGYEEAVRLIGSSERVAIKAGGGARNCSIELRAFAEAVGAPVVLAPGSVGVLPDGHDLNMHVGGSKGTISGNYVMGEADLLIVVGSRAVCQSDCSGIGWPQARHVININADPTDVQHYNNTVALTGDGAAVLSRLNAALGAADRDPAKRNAWHTATSRKKQEWAAFKAAQYAADCPHDPVWGTRVLTQPQAIKAVADFCAEKGAVKFFDAGDVQANGFQIVEDEHPGQTYTDSGASYMGFAASALLASGLTANGRYGVAFSGDGSFMMNPQVLIDGVEHGVHGTVVIFDNRRMAAISALQHAQYSTEFCTNDTVQVDYVRLAEAVDGVRGLWGGTATQSLRVALDEAYAHKGLSLVHVPVYYGPDPVGSMGAYGQWNVGIWCEDVQTKYVNTLI